jgi:acyl-CoA dehydrogenase
MGLLFFLVLVFMLGYLAYNRSSLLVTTICSVAYVVLITLFGDLGFFTLLFVWLVFAALLVPLNVPELRMTYMIKPLYAYAKKMLPTLSDTEEEALQSGTVNWDGELFSGKPNWKDFFSKAAPSVSQEEQEFLDTKVEKLASMIDSWDIIHNRYDLPDEIKDYARKNGFLSFGTPKEYGGLEFSDFAHSEVLVKIASRNNDVSQFIAVPNSLGPAELVRKYGTDEQKKHYLPRLAKGVDIPCFALTAPLAGSDASAMIDRGVVEKGMFEGKEIVGIRLNFDKRYITLAPIATLLGLAFKLYDPEHLMGDKDEYGITCALLPYDTPGVSIGRRHFPLHQAFPNGPIRGKDVFIPLDWIIGGPAMAGKGWKMLMECLAVGRAISLPTGAVTACKVMNHATALYCKIRRAFRIPIGKFEGVQEKLAENAGLTYIADAVRMFTLAAIDRGEKPAVPSAISKYHTTEMSRRVVLNAMDVHGGKGVMMGPKNYVAAIYEGNPIGVTVEGANILTRNMIIFGQGGIRCHPYLLKEVLALRADNIDEFEHHLMGHIGFAISNGVRSLFLGATDGHLVQLPEAAGTTKRYVQQLTRLSAAFSYVADVTMILLGGKLKFKESISARLGDVLSNLYMLSAVLKRFHDEGQPAHMLPIIHWSCQHLLFEAQKALDGIIRNFPNRLVAFAMRLVVFPLGRWYEEPDDKLRHQVAELLLDSQDVRERLAKGIYLSPEGNNLIYQLDDTVKQLDATLDIENRILRAQRDAVISGYDFPDCIKDAKKHGIITAEEEKMMTSAYQAMMDVINVDDFAASELGKKSVKTV